MNGQYDLEIVRPMACADIFQVVEIERQVKFHPWAQNAFSECLKAGYQCWVIDSDDQVIAYIVPSFYCEESYMLNLAVNSTQQGHGLGRGLVKKACVDVAKNGVVKILLEVRSNNLIVRQFYESEGFLVFGRRNNYYRFSGQTEDALAMVRVLGPASVMMQ